MSFVSIECSAASGAHEALCQLLEDAGAIAVTSDDAGDRPVLEPAPGQTPLWPQVHVAALFEADIDPAPLLSLLTHLGARDVACRRVADQDWARSGQDVAPRHFGGRLWVCPTDAPLPAPDAIAVRLDAGLGFGTGAHPTTALCLRWLAAHPPAGQGVIDWGCGSGILAVAAALLGAPRVLACDIDPQALVATTDNAARNGVGGQVRVVGADAVPVDARADLVIANILAPVLVALAPRLVTTLRPRGALLLSGLLESQVNEVLAAFMPALRFAAPTVEHGWVCLQGTTS